MGSQKSFYRTWMSLLTCDLKKNWLNSFNFYILFIILQKFRGEKKKKKTSQKNSMCVCVKQLFPAPADISLDFLWYSSDRLCESSTSDWSASSFTLVHGTLQEPEWIRQIWTCSTNIWRRIPRSKHLRMPAPCTGQLSGESIYTHTHRIFIFRMHSIFWKKAKKYIQIYIEIL